MQKLIAVLLFTLALGQLMAAKHERCSGPVGRPGGIVTMALVSRWLYDDESNTCFPKTFRNGDGYRFGFATSQECINLCVN
ncbi:hypothetical protein HDE_07644 [Halotydeus destructor]|nr:hypothetical protein HDE_07644 [Halotydeus destructor]